MSFLLKLLGQDGPENSISADEERFWINSASVMTSSGARVSADTALRVSTAWACTRLISETVAMLPHIVYKRMSNGGKERANDHPLYDILHDQPNKRQTSFEFTDMLQMHALLRGSGYAKIISGPRGPVDKLIPVHPDRVLDVEEVDDDTLRYKILDRGGQVNTYLDDEIFELRGLSLDGVKTVSVMTYARESFGLSIAAENFGAKLFRNYSRPGGFLKHPGHLSTEAQDRLREQTERQVSGENLHRLGILEEGMEYQQVTLSPEDSQMLQTREFQAEDVCRWWRVPPHMVGLTSKATSWGSGIEELSRGFVAYVLMPWLVRWQQTISKDLIIATEQYFVEFLTEALLRGDIEKRYNAYNIGRTGGWLASNDIRRFENMNPIPGGDDDYLTALNMKRSLDSNGNPNSGNAHYQQIVQESAARVVRKEVAAMTRAAERKDNDWYSAVDEFCKSHVEFVAQTMCIPFVTAILFVESGRKELTDKGPMVLAGWANRRTSELIRLSLED